MVKNIKGRNRLKLELRRGTLFNRDHTQITTFPKWNGEVTGEPVMKLSRTVGYALRATLYLAAEEPNKPIPCSKIAKERDMPERFLLQILRNLVNQGVLRSTRGVDGGYTLAGAPSEVSLLNIIEAIDGPIERPDVGAAEADAIKSNESRLDAALKDVSATMRHQLDAIKVAHLLQPPRSDSVLVR